MRAALFSNISKVRAVMSAPAAKESIAASTRFGSLSRPPTKAPSTKALDAIAPKRIAWPTSHRYPLVVSATHRRIPDKPLSSGHADDVDCREHINSAQTPSRAPGGMTDQPRAGSAQDDHRAGRVRHDVVAHRAKQHAYEAPVAA